MRVQCCPVCHGRGELPHNFYSHATITSSTSNVKCKSCYGTGIIYLPTISENTVLPQAIESTE